jgi:hypothetical protein
VLDHARLKTLELEAKKAGIAINRRPASSIVPAVRLSNPMELDKISSAAGVILRGIESYLEELIQESANPGSDSISNQATDGKTLIAEAIESYLKDVEPPQREQKTYDEYRLVLYKFPRYVSEAVSPRG